MENKQLFISSLWRKDTFDGLKGDSVATVYSLRLESKNDEPLSQHVGEFVNHLNFHFDTINNDPTVKLAIKKKYGEVVLYISPQPYIAEAICHICTENPNTRQYELQVHRVQTDSPDDDVPETVMKVFLPASQHGAVLSMSPSTEKEALVWLTNFANMPFYGIRVSRRPRVGSVVYGFHDITSFDILTAEDNPYRTASPFLSVEQEYADLEAAMLRFKETYSLPVIDLSGGNAPAIEATFEADWASKLDKIFEQEFRPLMTASRAYAYYKDVLIGFDLIFYPDWKTSVEERTLRLELGCSTSACDFEHNPLVTVAASFKDVDERHLALLASEANAFFVMCGAIPMITSAGKSEYRNANSLVDALNKSLDVAKASVDQIHGGADIMFSTSTTEKGHRIHLVRLGHPVASSETEQTLKPRLLH